MCHARLDSHMRQSSQPENRTHSRHSRYNRPERCGEDLDNAPLHVLQCRLRCKEQHSHLVVIRREGPRRGLYCFHYCRESTPSRGYLRLDCRYKCLGCGWGDGILRLHPCILVVAARVILAIVVAIDLFQGEGKSRSGESFVQNLDLGMDH